EGDTDNDKQDCETRAFHRLAERLKKEFPRLPIIVLLDGLYANGPIMEHCFKNKWKFMIVLKDKSLPSVWEEYEVINELETKNKMKITWGNRKQNFQWVNEIEYCYGANSKNNIIIHIVVCNEKWKEVNHFGEVEIKKSRHAWLSNTPLNFSNVHDLCNLGARNRWAIETEILVEKRHGYQYEHCFSYNWNAMKGYHYLMRLGHLFSILAQYSERLIKKVKEFGVRGFIKLLRETIAGPWLNEETVKKRLDMKYQLRLV
ncbi:MAG: transposase, partial [Desulfobacteraceae bacterium]|nr:transposase [Desulfobacteraceae bacterium]